METDSKSPVRSSRSVYLIGGLVGVIALGVSGWFVREAFLRVRNNAVEKSMIGEARQVSSAAAQIFQEENRTTVPFSELAKYCGRPNSEIGLSSDGKIFGGDRYESTPGVLTKGGFFYVRHAAWSRRLSRWEILKISEGDEHTIKFEVDSGRIATDPAEAK